MRNKDSKIFVASVKNASKRLEFYGDVDLSNLYLLKLIYKYANYCTTYKQLQRLNSMVSNLQNTELICSEFQANRGADYPNVFQVIATSGVDATNKPPVLTNSSVTVEDGAELYTFSYDDLFSGYSDPDGDSLGSFVIKTLPSNGVLKYNGEEVFVGVAYEDPSLLVYGKDSDAAYVTSFTYSAFDNDEQLPLESNTVTCTVNVEAIVVVNQNPYVGDRAIYKENRATTVFSSDDFSSETIMPYLDPENDEIAYIRIDEISEANTGVYYYYDNPVTVGQQISKSELDNGVFYHVGPDSNSITTDSINVSIQTENNPNWVK